MFRKLLKYDMISVGRYWWILAVTMLGVAMAGGYSLRWAIDLIEAEQGVLLGLMLMIVFFACFVVLSASSVFTPLMVYWRFYKHFFTDEGYLTFTLPVSRKDLLRSKTLNAFIWSGMYAVLLISCICMIITAVAPGTLRDGLVERWNEVAFMGGWRVVSLVEIFLVLLAALVCSICMIQFCITFGAMIAKRGKVIAAIGIYYGMNATLSVIGQVLVLFGGSVIDEGMTQLLCHASGADKGVAMTLALLIILMMISALACAMYFITLGCLERRLNLA